MPQNNTNGDESDSNGGNTIEWTTLPLSKGRKEQLDQFRENNESWDAFLGRMIENDSPVPLTDERLVELIEKIPEKTVEEMNDHYGR